MKAKDLRVNAERLQNSLEEMARIGATPRGGVQRLALTDEDKQARDLFVRWLRELDLAITVDEMGNIFGKRAGKKDHLAPVMAGSHIDSQPAGGRFDGILGVMGALEALRVMREEKIETERPVVVAAWTNEEGCRFAPAMLGSGVWAGSLDLRWAYGRTDHNGKSFGDELRRIGYQGSVPCRKWPVHAYYEYHIEQGPILEKRGKTIGVPEGIVGLHWYDVQLEGEANHAGTTPMEGRKDAVCAAAEMILQVNGLPGRMSGGMVATVGELWNYPNSRNIIPGGVRFTVDIRSWDDDLALRAGRELRGNFEAIAHRRGCRVWIEETWSVKRSPFDGNLVRQVLDVSAELGCPSLRMVSGAGHDAGYVSGTAPVAMIFVPSIGGISHAEAEKTRWEDCEAGANVLLHAMLRSADEI